MHLNSLFIMDLLLWQFFNLSKMSPEMSFSSLVSFEIGTEMHLIDILWEIRIMDDACVNEKHIKTFINWDTCHLSTFFIALTRHCRPLFVA